MATIKPKTEAVEKTKKEPAWKIVIKPVKVIYCEAYCLVVVTEAQLDELRAVAPYELPKVQEQDDGNFCLLFDVGKYTVFGVLGQEIDLDETRVKGVGAVRLRAESYDWTYKGKHGHTDKIGLHSVNFYGAPISCTSFDDMGPEEGEDINAFEI